MLPTNFAYDFGDSVDRYATLVDRNHNSFEVLVERNNQGIFFTKGWLALRDFYNASLGAWITLVFVGNGRFNIRVRNRLGKRIRCPRFTPPMQFAVERNDNQMHLFNPFPVPFVHNEFNFQLTYEKKLDFVEIDSGFLVCFMC